MELQRRIVHNTIRVAEDEQTIAAGPVVLARARRAYPDDVVAARIDLWIETEVVLPSPNPRPGEPTKPWAAGLVDVVVLGTDQPVPDEGTWIASVDDQPLAWHIYRITTQRWTDVLAEHLRDEEWTWRR